MADFVDSNSSGCEQEDLPVNNNHNVENCENQNDEVPVNDSYNKELEELKDKYIRLLADFDNFKKRTIKEKEYLVKYSSEGIILDILSIFDDFEMAIKYNKDFDNKNDDGLLLIYNKFKDFLSRNNIKEINCENSIFDENYHECVAVEEVEDEQLKGKITKVLSKGYLYNDKVIRYSKVIIGK